MDAAQTLLLRVSVAANICLSVIYARQGLHDADFGNVRHLRLPWIKRYFLITAVASALCTFAYVGIVVSAPPVTRLSADSIHAVACAVASYTILQALFLPLVRRGVRGSISRIWTQMLLVLCILPTVVLSVVAVKSRDASLISLSLASLFHVTINDAVLFGGLF